MDDVADGVAAEAGAPASLAVAGMSLPELYREHRLTLVRLGVLLLGDQAAAEDVVQDVFTGMWRTGTLPHTPVAALAYLRRAVVNRSRSHVRRLVLARRKPPPIDPDVPGPSEAFELSEEHRSVLTVLARLPRRQREVLVLRYYSNLSVSEAAKALGINEGTVKSHTARGLAALRTGLEEDRP